MREFLDRKGSREGGRRMSLVVPHDVTLAILSSTSYAIPTEYDLKVQELTVEGTRYFQEELKRSKEREREYIAMLKKADTVHIMIGCCDARVGAPYKMVEREMFVYLPFIGGGNPGRESLAFVLNQLTNLGVAGRKIDIIATQHGTTEEIDDAAHGLDTEQCDCVECGLRLFRSQFSIQLDRIADETSISAKLGLAQEFSQELNGKISPNLILIAASRNWSGNITKNMSGVYNTIKPHARTEVFGGLFDHKKRQLHVLTPGWGDAWEAERVIDFPGEHKDHGQDPVAITIAVGPMATTMHAAVYLPGVVGRNGMKNDFSAAAPTGKMAGIKDAISQASYAAGNHLEVLYGTGHGGSFTNLQSAVFICDSAQYVDEAKKVIQSDWFLTYYREKFLPLHVLYFMDIETQEVSSVTLHNQHQWS